MSPASPEARAAFLRRIDALARTGRVAEACQSLLGYLDGEPEDWSAVEAAADLCMRAGREADAVRLRLSMARHWARGGATARARQLYEAVLAHAPQDAGAAFRLAEILAAQGETEEARRMLASLTENEPGTSGGVLPSGRVEEVVADLKAGRMARATSGLVRLAARARGLDGAVTEGWVEAAAASPEEGGRLALALADVCLVAGDEEAAIATLRRVLAHVAGAPAVAVWRRLVEIAADGGRGGVALEAQAGLADALAGAGRWEEAVAVAGDLAARLPDAANRDRLARLTSSPAAGVTSPASTVPVPTEPVPDLTRDLSDALDALGRP